MFDVGFAELFLLALIGLLILGPERLPKAARTLGGLVRKARTSWFALRRSIESELAAADMVEPLKKTSDDLKEISRRIDEIHTPTAGSETPDNQQEQAMTDNQNESRNE